MNKHEYIIQVAISLLNLIITQTEKLCINNKDTSSWKKKLKNNSYTHEKTRKNPFLKYLK